MSKLETNNTSTKGTRKLVVRVMRDVNLRAQGKTLNIRSNVYERQYPGFLPMFYGERCVKQWSERVCRPGETTPQRRARDRGRASE